MNRVAFSIFGLNIYFYSLFILLGVVVAYFIIIKESKRHKLNENIVLNLLFYGIIAGIFGARLYYVIFNFSYYIKNPMEILAFRNGGLAIHGGIISSIIFIYFYTKKYSLNFIRILDILSPGVIIAQCIGRWGNFFNQEAYGSLTTLSNLKQLFIPNFIIKGMYINNNYYYPTFYFESIWCLIGFIILIIIRNKNNLKLGTITGLYFIWYGFGRFFIEILRTDSLMFFNIKVAQIISILLIFIGLILIFKNKEKYLEVVK